MINFNPAVGAYLRDVLRGRGLSAEELGPALGIHPRTVFNWMDGKGRATGDQEHALRLCLGLDREWIITARSDGCGEPAPFVDPEFTHPHQKLVKDLVSEASCGMQKEVLGPPGMFKTAVLRDVERRLITEEGRAPRDCIYLDCRKDLGSIDNLWNALGQHAERRREPYTYAELRALLAHRKCVLLLDHLDEFLLYLRFRFPSDQDFARQASTWIVDLKALRAGIVAASTIHTAAHVRFVVPNYPTSIFLTPRFYQPPDDGEWNLWTAATIVRYGQSELKLEPNTWKLARLLKREVHKVPLAFTTCLARMTVQDGAQYSDRLVGVQKALQDVMHTMGACIWNRIPARARRDLFDQKFSFQSESSVAVAFRNSGILIEERDCEQRPALVPLVSDWIAQWRREAVT